MAKIVKPERNGHEMRIRSDFDNGELLIVGRSKRNTYLWAGSDGNHPPVTISGPATLRKLAKRILEIVGDEP